MIVPESLTNPSTAELVNVRVEFAPGQFTNINLPRDSLGRYGFVKTRLMADGSVVPVWREWSATMKVSRDLPAKLGLDVHVDTIRCLIHAGIVKAGKFAPSLTLVDVDSLIRHLLAVMKDSAAVWTDEKQLAYSEAWQELRGHTGGMTRRAKRKRGKKPRPQIPPPPAKKAQAVIPVILPASDPMQPDLFPL